MMLALPSVPDPLPSRLRLLKMSKEINGEEGNDVESPISHVIRANGGILCNDSYGLCIASKGEVKTNKSGLYSQQVYDPLGPLWVSDDRLYNGTTNSVPLSCIPIFCEGNGVDNLQ